VKNIRPELKKRSFGDWSNQCSPKLTNVAQRQSYGRTVSPGELLASRGSTSEDPTQGARDRDHGGPRPVGGAEDRAGAKPRGHAVDPVILVADGDHGAFHPGVHQSDDSKPVPQTAAVAAARVEHVVAAWRRRWRERER
jgi:hypothetical protein